jgi:hypothetical protein
MTNTETNTRRKATRPVKITRQAYIGFDGGLDTAINIFIETRGTSYPDFVRQACREKLNREIQKDQIYMQAVKAGIASG